MMFALALSATAFEVELELGGAPGQMFVIDDPTPMPQMGISFSGLPDLFSMVERLQQEQTQQLQQLQRRAPTHPCENDQMRFRCLGSSATVSCLKSHLKELSPTCTTYLLASAEPEPSPSPMAVGTVMHSFTDENGQWHTEKTNMNSREGRKVAGEIEEMMGAFMPDLFRGLFNEPKRQPSRSSVPPAPRAGKPNNAHPCEKEVNQCKAELGGNPAREQLQQCLVSHYAQLSSDCKCFLHQVMGGELEKQVPAAKSTAGPHMRTVATTGAPRAVPVYEQEYVEYVAYAPHKPSHKLTCALFMTLFVISVWLVLYRVCRCCCAPKPKFAAVVPPTQPVKMSIEPLVAPVTSTKQ